MSSSEGVTLSIAGYNQIKAENTRFQMFISRLWEGAELKEDYSGIKFDAKLVEDLIHLIYPDQYKKKLATLRTQQTKLSLAKLNITEPKEESENGKDKQTSESN